MHTDTQNNPQSDENFMKDVIDGLSQHPKHLHSKYFYDEEGDKLFQKIMEMPEYYLTDCELDIFKHKTDQLLQLITNDNSAFDLIELGAGDAMKSAYLLQFMTNKGYDFTYMPVDISGNILNILDEKLKKQMPNIAIQPLQGDYFKMLDKATNVSQRRKVVLFLGGNIGNMEVHESYDFCRELASKLNKGDRLVIGFDLKKNPHTILRAYNDATGITASFNLNLLTRINRELGGDFNVNNFSHYSTYDPESGACKSYLVSLKNQEVSIGDRKIIFEKDECIYMEISQKYAQNSIDQLAFTTGFRIVDQLKDRKKWFVDSVWEVV